MQSNQFELVRLSLSTSIQFECHSAAWTTILTKSSILHATNLHYDLSPRRVAVPCHLECPENKSFSDHSGSNTATAQAIQELSSLFSIPLPISSEILRLRPFNRC